MKRIKLNPKPELPPYRVNLEPRSSNRTAVIRHGLELACGRGMVVCQAAAKLIEQGIDKRTPLEVYRGDILCLRGEISAFADLIHGKDEE